MHIGLIAVLVGAVIAGCLWWLGRVLLAQFSLGDPFGRIASIALVLICILIFIGFALGRIPLPTVSL